MSYSCYCLHSCFFLQWHQCGTLYTFGIPNVAKYCKTSRFKYYYCLTILYCTLKRWRNLSKYCIFILRGDICLYRLYLKFDSHWGTLPSNTAFPQFPHIYIVRSKFQCSAGSAKNLVVYYWNCFHCFHHVFDFRHKLLLFRCLNNFEYCNIKQLWRIRYILFSMYQRNHKNSCIWSAAHLHDERKAKTAVSNYELKFISVSAMTIDFGQRLFHFICIFLSLIVVIARAQSTVQ